MSFKPVVVVAFLLLHAVLFAQNAKPVPSPVVNDFAPIQSFLASGGIEGRETGTRGAAIASDYIASMMQNSSLVPFNPVNASKVKLSDYFQPFKLTRIKTEKSSMDISSSKNKNSRLHLNIYNNFKVRNVLQTMAVETTPVFAGYGIVAPGLGYNDYTGLNVKGKIVLIMEGYPGQNDSGSIAREKFRPAVENDEYDLDYKCLEAARQGATAVITVSKAYLEPKQSNKRIKNVAPVKNPDYEDAEYVLPENVNKSMASCYRLNKSSSEKVAATLGIDFRKAEQQIARQMKFEPLILKNSIKISTSTTIDTITVNNVIGLLPGRDTSQAIILGAHYDHLGKRGDDVFYGSDDNASGVAGLLALAKAWAESGVKPSCNIVFASWTAEEKGLIGSEYFVSKLLSPEKVKLYINLDMISRSVIEDTAHRQLSIGTRTIDDNLRNLARRCNSVLDRPFVLDLWDVTGRSGSDYASFTAKNIPVMTYNTGLHDDYHTPRDIPANADLVKMGDVLKLVNESLMEVLENRSGE